VHRRRFALAFATAVVLALACVPRIVAGQGGKQHRIAYLSGYSDEIDKPLFSAFVRGLGDFGYVEGRNIAIDRRYAGGTPERLAALAAELVRLKPDVFVVGAGAAAAEAVRAVSGNTPIVMANVQDPVASGLVKSLARPGSNITGMSDFHAAIPKASRLAILFDPTATKPDGTPLVGTKELEVAARSLSVRLTLLPVNGPEDFVKAFAEAGEARAEAVLLSPSPVLSFHNKLLLDLAARQRLPAVYGNPESVKLGGLMSYGPSYTALFHRAATYVDKIVKGAKPADLPIEQPVKFELAINLKTAKALGISVPRALVLRADHVIQ
jgi:putative ABC transport system substrate-binding protein